MLTLVSKYLLQDGFSAKADRVASSAKKAGEEVDKSSKKVSGFRGVMSAFGNALTGGQSKINGFGSALDKGFRGAVGIAGNLFSILLKVGVAAGAVGVAMLGLAGFALKSAAEMDGLERALAAVAGGAAEAKRQMKELKGLADRSPVLDLKSAVKGAVQLQASGFGSGESQDIMGVISNAIAQGGGNIEGFQAVLVNLQQIASQGKLTGDELRETAAYIPALRKAMQAAFGTTDSAVLKGFSGIEVIRGLVRELAKLPQVGGGIQTLFDNLGSAIFLASAKVGQSIFAGIEVPLTRVIAFLEYLTSSGILTSVTQGFLDLFHIGGDGGGLIKAMAYVVAVLKNLPNIIRSVATYFVQVWETTGKTIYEILKQAFMIFTTARVIVGIMQMITAIAQLTKAIAALAAAEATAAAMTGVGLALVAAAVAAGAAVYLGLNALTNNITGGIQDAIKGMPELPVWKQIDADQASIMNGFKEAAPVAGGIPSSGAPGGAFGQNGVMASIAMNTKETAQNTRAQLDMSAHVFGGNDLGSGGLSAGDIARIKGRGGRSKNVSITAPTGPMIVADAHAFIVDIIAQYEGLTTGQRGLTSAR